VGRREEPPTADVSTLATGPCDTGVDDVGGQCAACNRATAIRPVWYRGRTWCPRCRPLAKARSKRRRPARDVPLPSAPGPRVLAPCRQLTRDEVVQLYGAARIHPAYGTPRPAKMPSLENTSTVLPAQPPTGTAEKSAVLGGQ
jgi:hypothetical protein